MSVHNYLYILLQQCNISLNDEIISRELLLKAYSQYLSNIIGAESHTVGISLHTGSICFDVISVLYMSLGCLLYDETTPDDVIATLNEGDIILYGKSRAIYLGKADNGFVRIKQETVDHGHKSTLNSTIAPMNFYRIKPYNGTSTTLDSRGIRTGSKVRADFIETVFGKNRDGISSTISKSAVVVSGREVAETIVRGTKIHYGKGKTITLSELVSASYYTENDEYIYPGNPGKNQPVLRFMNKISLAREHIFDDEDNRILSLIVLGKQTVDAGATELPELMNRRSLKYVLISYAIIYDDNGVFLESYPEADLFACTEEFLLAHTMPSTNKEGLIGEIGIRVGNILEKRIETYEIDGMLDFDAYINLKTSIRTIRNNALPDDDTEYFVIQSYSLLNLFSAAVFTMSYMEQAIAQGIIVNASPAKQLKRLGEIVDYYPGLLGETMSSVYIKLDEIYRKLHQANTKYEELFNIIFEAPVDCRIMIIVPKAFYKVLIKSLLEINGLNERFIDVETAGKFDFNCLYDSIIVVGSLKGKGFNAFSCSSASQISVLLYLHEIPLHKYQESTYKKNEQFYNQHSKIKLDLDTTEWIEESQVNSVFEIDMELEQYIETLTVKSALHTVNTAISSSNVNLKADIIRIATSQDGEAIFFSKYYSPYVLDREQMTVMESNVKSLCQGDIILFTKYTEQTKDIVDEIISKMMTASNIDIDVSEAFRKSKHWKHKLRGYIGENNVSYRELSAKMAEYGTPKHELTLRTWINEESHIVGPREKDAFYQIALICEDEEMLSDPESFHAACKTIRSLRIKILRLIGTGVIRSFQGIQDEPDELLSIIEEKVGELSQIVQIETITDVYDVQIPAYLANRPYST